MRVVGRGNANILIDYGDPKYLYRCCVRFPDSLKQNNLYSVKNFEYINTIVEPLLEGLLCPMELEVISLDCLEKLLSQFISSLDDANVIVTKLRNLKPPEYTVTLYSDHFTRVYCTIDKSRVLMEFKPKWLHGAQNYCRNCTHNILKRRNIKYCYKVVLNNPACLYEALEYPRSEVPSNFIENAITYFHKNDNILKRLYRLQGEFHSQRVADIKHADDVTEELLLEMTLKDVTCFLEWRLGDPISCHVVDVDRKPKEKWLHWFTTDEQLCKIETKVKHD